jgi:F-type H+-transporting ATPase subunit delta
MSSVVATRYAAALIDLAHEQGKLDNTERDLRDMAAMIAASEDLRTLIRSPRAGKAGQERALAALAEKAKFDALTRNFIGVLVQNRRLNALEEIIRAFGHEISVRRGEVTVNVETAQDLTPAQARALAQSISKSVGREVTLNASVNPGIIGGMIVTVGSQMIDDSVARKLERLKGTMSKQSNQNVSQPRKTKGA